MKLTERAIKLIRLILPIVVGVMLSLCAVLFIISACSINQLGQSPYNYESIGAAFSRIAVPVYITLALVIISGIALTLLSPDGKERVKPSKDALSRLLRQTRTTDLDSCDKGTAASIKRERKLRSVLYYVNVGLFALGTLVALVISAIVSKLAIGNGITFNDLLYAVLLVSSIAFNCLIPAIILAFARIPLEMLSAERELALLSGLPRKKPATPEIKKGNLPYMLIIRLSVIAIALAFIVIGVFNGGMADVVQKAIKICTECIGLG